MMVLTPAQRTMLLWLCDPFLRTSSVLLNKEVHLLNHDGEEDDLPIAWKCGTFSIKPKKVPCKSAVNPLDSPVKLPTLSLYATRHSKGTLQSHNNKPIREAFELIKNWFTLCFSSPWEIPGSPRTGLAMSTFWTRIKKIITKVGFHLPSQMATSLSSASQGLEQVKANPLQASIHPTIR